ncbi:Transcription factor SRM1, partial [Mucuna pruriens]
MRLLLFLYGLNKYGKGNWKSIAQVVRTRTSIQVASHAQKYYLRLNNVKEKKRSSIHDITLKNTNNDQHNSEHPIQQLHENQPQEMSNLQNDNLMDFEDNFIVEHIDQHIDQHSWPPLQEMQQLPHHTEPNPNYLGSLPDIQCLPHHTKPNNLAPLPSIQQYSPHHTNPNNLAPLPSIQQYSPLPSIQQYSPPYIDPYDELGRILHTQYLPRNVDPRELIPPPDLEIKQFPYLFDPSSCVPTPNHGLPHHLDKKSSDN